jgi:hypothetical protein
MFGTEIIVLMPRPTARIEHHMVLAELSLHEAEGILLQRLTDTAVMKFEQVFDRVLQQVPVILAQVGQNAAAY